ncbi:MAG: hypothetical protein IIY00_06195, partial [Clostridia bacterium]|nr:hypothetical protein [Clostridia bacterium]
MRDFKEKLFPLAVLAGALLVLGLMLRILVINPKDVLTGPPDLYITLDDGPVFVQESDYNWATYEGYKRSGRARKGKESFPSAEDEIITSSEDLSFDFGKYAPTHITVTYASTLTGEKTSIPVENNKFELLPGT